MYRGLVEEISDWICDVDEHFICTYSSPRVRNVLGYEPEEVLGRSAFDFMPPDEADRLKSMISPDHHPGKVFDIMQCRLRRKDGHIIWIEISGKPVIDRQGRFKCNRGLVRDITERKNAEEAQSESEERFRAMFDRAAMGIAVADPEGHFVDTNPVYQELLGYSGEELRQKRLYDITHPEDVDKSRDLEGQLRDGLIDKYQLEKRYVRKDGGVIWGKLNVSAIRNPDGSQKYNIGVLEDITERKQAERALADEKDRAELYLDLMGHDINNLNQVAHGYLELIDGTVEDEELKQLVSKPMEAIRESSRLIENVRKLQRGRSGNYRPEVYDIGELVEKVASQFTSRPDKYVSIACSAVKGMRVQANELLRDVFSNLIDNAIKHTAGPVFINVRVLSGAKKEKRQYCTVMIDDNGPGIPDDMKERVFNRMQRGDTKASGSGLGLYLVKTLVDSYGGKVWVEDRVKGDYGKGARFMVMLPVM